MKVMKCPVCRTKMRWYLNPGRWKCMNIKRHDAETARLRLGGVTRGVKAGGWSKRKKK